MSKLESRNGPIDREVGILVGLVVFAFFVVLGYYAGMKDTPPAADASVAAVQAGQQAAPAAVAPTQDSSPEAPAPQPAAQAPTPAPQPAAQAPTPAPQPVVQAPTPAPQPVVQAPTPAPQPVVQAPTPAPQPAPQAPAPTAGAAPTPADQVWRVPVYADDAQKGPKDAPATVVVFTAFGCGTCTQFAPAIDRIVQKHGDKLRIVFKHKVIPADPFAIEASMAALAAKNQGKFWEYQDKLWKTSAPLTDATLESVAQELGLDMGKFKRDAKSDALRGQVLRDALIANEVGAHSMPNVLVNGVRMAGEKSYESLERVVEQELGKAEEAIAKGREAATLYDEAVKDGKFFPQLEDAKFAFASDDSPSKGPKDAKVVVTTFEDFECPFCAKVAGPLEQFQAMFPTQVRLVYKQFPLTSIHPKAQLAAEASMAAHEQGKFWEYHDLLYANQQALDRPDLERYAEQLGLEMAKFRSALDSGRWKPFIDKEMRDGVRAQVGGTPSVFLNGQRYQGPRGYPPEGLEAVSRVYLGLGQ